MRNFSKNTIKRINRASKRGVGSRFNAGKGFMMFDIPMDRLVNKFEQQLSKYLN